MKFDNQLRLAMHVVETFRGNLPLHGWLKNFYRENKQMGSNDRKLISRMVYSYYRLGHALKQMPVRERILTGLFLCNQESNELLGYFKPDWNEKIALPPREKYEWVDASFSLHDIFPWKTELSKSIDADAFSESFLIQPDLFIRLRPGREEQILQKLRDAGIDFRLAGVSCIALPNTTNLDRILETDIDAVVQDYSSQQTERFMQPPGIAGNTGFTAWDCCAGSGGKSILLYDSYPEVILTVSDIRKSILANLSTRFQKAGIKEYISFVSDLSAERPRLPEASSDLVIADVPCSGSGTWSRTPEALFFFNPHEIKRYQDLQKKIVSSIIPTVRKGGQLVYITCSVFREENEEMAAYIQSNSKLQPGQMEWLKGYQQKADSMFVASFTA
jgi:16S rRNA (cytosine967-C5)-methyltransferase